MFDDDKEGILQEDGTIEEIKEEEDGSVEIDAEPSEEVDDSPRPSARRERKSSRYDGFLKESKAEAERARQEAESARMEAQRARMELAELRGKFESNNKPADPLGDELNKNYQARQELYDYMMSKTDMSDEDRRAAVAKARSLEKEHVSLVAREEARKALDEYKKSQPDHREQVVRYQYADVLGSPRGQSAFKHYWEGALMRGETPNDALMIDSLNKARSFLAGGNKPPPDRKKLSGQSSYGSEGRAEGKSTLTLNPRQRAMADAAFASEKDPATRYRKYAQRLEELNNPKQK